MAREIGFELVRSALLVVALVCEVNEQRLYSKPWYIRVYMLTPIYRPIDGYMVQLTDRPNR